MSSSQASLMINNNKTRKVHQDHLEIVEPLLEKKKIDKPNDGIKKTTA